MTVTGGTPLPATLEPAQPILCPDLAVRMLDALGTAACYVAEAEQILLAVVPVAVAAAYERWLSRG